VNESIKHRHIIETKTEALHHRGSFSKYLNMSLCANNAT